MSLLKYDPATGTEKPYPSHPEQDGKPYAGCFVNASVEIFPYENSGNGISAQLRGVQFLRHGDAFAGGRPASEDEFDDIAAGATADDLV